MTMIELLDCQTAAVDDTFVRMSNFKGLASNSKGDKYPFVHIIRAITGAGKTPVLAGIASRLDPAIILWTTPLSAVVAQTVSKLKSAYAKVLESNTSDVEVHELESLTPSMWDRVLQKRGGITILVGTVGLFNRQDLTTNIHKNNYWDALATKRCRPVTVIYDECHNLTRQQAGFVMALKPSNVVLASGSGIQEAALNVIHPLEGEDVDAVIDAISYEISTEVVVEKGLLKSQIEFNNTNLDRSTAIKRTIRKKSEIDSKLASITPGNVAVACYIVTLTQDGIDVWDELVKQGVDPERIAVHLDQADKYRDFDDSTGRVRDELICTIGMTPDDIRAREFDHIIFNKSLKEGWDEPYAFVGYVDKSINSPTDIDQKIGRFLRNPFRTLDGAPIKPEDDDLATAFFFLNYGTDEFANVLDGVRKRLRSTFPGIKVREIEKVSENAYVKNEFSNLTVARIAINYNKKDLQRQLLKKIIAPAEADRWVRGEIQTVVLDVGTQQTTRDNLVQLEQHYTHKRICEVVRDTISARDPRVIRGGKIDDEFWETDLMRTTIAIGSVAYNTLVTSVSEFCDSVLPNLTSHHPSDDEWNIRPQNRITRKDGIDDIVDGKNAVHVGGYSGLNGLEMQIANYLITRDDVAWMRNPSHANAGFSIPMKSPVDGSTNYYPDFIVFVRDEVVFVEGKGRHLLSEAIARKQKYDLPEKQRIVFVTQERDGTVTVNQFGDTQSFSSMRSALSSALDL